MEVVFITVPACKQYFFWPFRRSPAFAFAEAPGSTFAGHVSHHVEGGSLAEHKALWESGGVYHLGEWSHPWYLDSQTVDADYTGIETKGNGDNDYWLDRDGAY